MRQRVKIDEGAITMRIFPIKAFFDNYIWVILEQEKVIVVDPGESSGVLTYLEEHSIKEVTILLTHKHDDHVGGVEAIVTQYPKTIVYGPEETQEFNDQTIYSGDIFELNGNNFEVFDTPGHTEGHISYLMDEHLFCGDALFSAGCGRVFTGDYQAQYNTLQKFAKLPKTVKVYAAHEYTLTNLEFAQSVEPENQVIGEALEEVRKKRKKDQSTLPSTIGREHEINLFLRADTVGEFTRLRKLRDNF